MVELIAARGNTSLESAVSLTRELRLDMQDLAQRMAQAASSSEEYSSGSSRSKATIEAENENELKLIIHDVKKLMARIEDAVPLINLALTTSGARLSTHLPSTVSPSRLLQASTLLTAGDTQYALSPRRIAQIGPAFTLSVYMLFAGHDRPETEEEVRNTTWKEVIHKAQVKLRRVPLDVVMSTGSGSDALQSHKIQSSHDTPSQADTPSQVRAEMRADEYAYQLMVIEDLDDGRHHDFEDDEAKPTQFDDVQLAGVREMIPVHEVSKIFYADTSKVLNIGTDAESNHPVLLLRRDVQAVPPRRMVDQDGDGPTNREDADDGKPQSKEEKEYVDQDHEDRKQDPWRMPSSLDPEWIAFEVYTEDQSVEEDSDDEDARNQEFATPGEEEPRSSDLSMELSSLNLDSPTTIASQAAPANAQPEQPWVPRIKTSLSLLELLLRLTSLQQFQQQSHLSIPDELLNFFLEEAASTGAGGNEKDRKAIRADARRKVGWDPYDESPIKRRGEDYQYTQPQYYDSPRNQQHQYSYNGSVASPSPRNSPAPPFSTQRMSHQSPSHGVDGSMSSPAPGQPVQTMPQSPSYVADGAMDSPSSSIKPPSRNIAGMPDGSSVHKSITINNRPDWLKQSGLAPSRGSPLRPATAHSDEGIGTSPASIPEAGQK